MRPAAEIEQKFPEELSLANAGLPRAVNRKRSRSFHPSYGFVLAILGEETNTAGVLCHVRFYIFLEGEPGDIS